MVEDHISQILPRSAVNNLYLFPPPPLGGEEKAFRASILSDRLIKLYGASKNRGQSVAYMKAVLRSSRKQGHNIAQRRMDSIGER